VANGASSIAALNPATAKPTRKGPRNAEALAIGRRVVSASLQRDPRVPAPGTQLIKRYKDATLTVTVLEDGYQYGERVYKSLSAIAREVTGTQWNGYLFLAVRSGSPRVAHESALTAHVVGAAILLE
jgi:hypothetical protein